MSAELLAEALYQRAQAARQLASFEQQYRQFVIAAFPRRRARELNPRDREQYEQALARYRQGYEDCRHALQEMDWIVEQLETSVQTA